MPYSPHQNAKQEVFWASFEGRLLAMLEGESELTLALLIHGLRNKYTPFYAKYPSFSSTSLQSNTVVGIVSMKFSGHPHLLGMTATDGPGQGLDSTSGQPGVPSFFPDSLRGSPMFSLTLKIVMHLASVAVLTATATAQYTLVHDDGIEIEVSPLLGEPNYGPNTDDDDVINHNYTDDGLDGRESRGDASDDTQSPSVGEVNMTVSDSFSFYVLSEGETSIQGMVKVTGECRARLEDAIGIAAAIAYGSSHIAYGDQEKEAEDDAEIAIGAGNPNHIGVTISGFGFETNTVQATGATQSALLEDLSTGLPEPADAATVDFVRKGHGLWDIEKGLVEVGWEVQTMAKLTVTSAEPAE